MTTAVASGNAKAQRLSLARWKVPLGLAAALVVAYLVIAADAGNQAQAQFINALTIGAIYALIALGYTMVYGIIELINFAHGEIFMCGSFVSWCLLTTLGFTDADRPIPLVLIGALLLTFVVSMLVMGMVGVRHRAVRLPAAAERAAPGPADHGHRRQLHPPEHRLRDGQQLHRHGPPAHPQHAAHDRPDPDQPDQPVRDRPGPRP